jgi:hypothetical protein
MPLPLQMAAIHAERCRAGGDGGVCGWHVWWDVWLVVWCLRTSVVGVAVEAGVQGIPLRLALALSSSCSSYHMYCCI